MNAFPEKLACFRHREQLVEVALLLIPTAVETDRVDAEPLEVPSERRLDLGYEEMDGGRSHRRRAAGARPHHASLLETPGHQVGCRVTLVDVGEVDRARSSIVNAGRVRELQAMFNGDFVVVLRDGTRVSGSRRYRQGFDALTRS